MRTQSGYIIPAILIVILLILAGWVTFGLQTAPEVLAPAPENEKNDIPVQIEMPIQDSFVEEMIVSTTTEVDLESDVIVE